MGNSTLTDMTLLPGVEPVVAGLAAGSSSSPGQEGKARKKPMKSLYLKFFDTAPDGKSRICRKSYCMTTATGKCVSSGLPPRDNVPWLIQCCPDLSTSADTSSWPQTISC
jgi:hypothetical protein